MEKEKYTTTGLGIVLYELWKYGKIIISINIITLMIQIMTLIIMLKKM